MKMFMIENETDNITVYTFAKDADEVKGAERFRNEAGLAKLAADWPVSRLVDVWNGLPGVIPVKKFKDRATAVARIWKAIQSLGDAVMKAGQDAETAREPIATATDAAPQTPDVAPVEAPASKAASRAKKPPQSAKAKETREGSKTETVLALLRREGGVTAQELMTATGWQAHSVRGFIAGTARKKMGLTITSSKGENGGRVYSVVK